MVHLLIVAWNAKENMKKSLAHLLLLLFTLLLPFKAVNSAQPAITGIDINALDQVVEAQMAKHGLPGVSLAVVQGAEIVHLKGYGTAGGRPMTPQTQMFIGSQSKSFTALLIAQLADQGLIDLNAPVQTYIPWFQVDDENATSRITVNHLLHHTSGLSEAGHSVLLPDDATLEEAVRSLSKARLTAPVGTQFQYFNLGYTVLACIIELVSGQNYARLSGRAGFRAARYDRSTA
jgi:CubicO group peptidase (beta-lactamase class C family)